MKREKDLIINKNHNIIVIDDNKDFLKITKSFLSEFFPNCNIQYFNKVNDDFCKHISKQKIDLFIIDIKVGSVNGIDLCEKIVDIKKGSIFLFVSGYNYTIDSFSKLNGTCIYDFIAKPFTKGSFLGSIVSLLNISTTYKSYKKTGNNSNLARNHYMEIIKKDKEMIRCLKDDFNADCLPAF